MEPGSATGFTLIELLVVITLIAILAASVIVRIRGVQDDRALQIAADDLASAIHFGFEEYRLKGVIHRLAFADGGASYRLEEATGDAGQPYQPVRGVAGVYRRFPAGVEIGAVTKIEVTATGRGIAPENVARIFDPFFTTKPGETGTGLGLALCKEKMEHNGGSISLVTTSSAGTTFRLLFPAEVAGPEG